MGYIFPILIEFKTFDNNKRYTLLILGIMYSVLIFRLEKYGQRKTGLGEMHSQVLSELTDVEKMLIETQEVVESKGKVS